MILGWRRPAARAFCRRPGSGCHAFRGLKRILWTDQPPDLVEPELLEGVTD